MKYLALVLLAAALLLATTLLPGSGQAEASSFWSYVCIHSGQPYHVVTVPLEHMPPNCPDFDPAWNAVKDPQDGLNCTGQGGIGACHKDRHIDCEYDAMPGDI